MHNGAAAAAVLVQRLMVATVPMAHPVREVLTMAVMVAAWTVPVRQPAAAVAAVIRLLGRAVPVAVVLLFLPRRLAAAVRAPVYN